MWVIASLALKFQTICILDWVKGRFLIFECSATHVAKNSLKLHGLDSCLYFFLKDNQSILAFPLDVSSFWYHRKTMGMDSK